MDPRLNKVLIDNYHQHYAKVNRAFDAEHLRWYARYAEANLGHLIRGMPAEGGKVLDLGCGAGLLLSWLTTFPTITAVGLDGSPGQLAEAKKLSPSAELHDADALTFLRERPQTFRGIVCSDFIEHLPDGMLFDVICAAHEALLPGGFLWVRVPNAACLLGTYTRYMNLTHYQSFTSASLAELLGAAGFQAEVPQEREVSWKAKVRRGLQDSLHRMVFRICGSPRERVFTRNVIAIGRR